MFSFFKREENLLDNNNIYNNMSKVLNNNTLNESNEAVVGDLITM